LHVVSTWNKFDAELFYGHGGLLTSLMFRVSDVMPLILSLL